ncbi:MAG TPA: hypothetical protein VMU17_06085 [Elusimicrobiota bacterium]|nr:hypothetical protein [Elusimicrobiota bacterium]
MRIDASRQVDEPRGKIQRLHLPGQIMRIGWNTVAAKSDNGDPRSL